MAGALVGVRVLEIGLLVQGPQAAAMLASMGADVIKIELPVIGDHSRWIPVAVDDPRSAYFEGCNRGKRSVTLDLREAEGAALFKEMARTSDVVISNFKPGTMEEWGLGYDELKAENGGIIWASGSTFGALGPDADREGADLAGQCEGGLISTVGYDGTPYSPVGVTIADHIAAQNLVAGVLTALFHRERTGAGQRIDVSLLGGQIWAQASEYTHLLMTDEIPGRGNFSHALLRGFYGIFRTADGWIGLIGVPPDLRDAFFITLERPDLSTDERFLGSLTRERNVELHAELGEAFRTRTTGEWRERLMAAGVRYAVVRNYRQVLEDPGAWENGYFQRVRNAEGEEVAVVGVPIAMTETPLTPGAVAPRLGQHTEEVLGELGYGPDAIARFKEKGVA